jgi:hypothetical protein
MAKLKENTVVIGEFGQAVPLAAGDDVPKWAAKQVGDHLLEEAKPARSSRSSRSSSSSDSGDGGSESGDDAVAPVDDRS